MSFPAPAPVLLIEDDPDMRDMVVGLLDDEVSTLMVAHSAREGLARLQATPDHMVVVTSGVIRDMSAADMLAAVVRDGGLARRHAFVLVTPEEHDIETVSAWRTRVPLFIVLEPYGRDELLVAVARAAQCADLSRDLCLAPLTGDAFVGKLHAAADDGEEVSGVAATTPPSPLGSVLGIVVVGGEPGIRTLVSHTLAYAHLAAAHTSDHQVALAWLRACRDPMVVVLNGTRAEQHFDLLLEVVNEASLVRHTYLLMLPHDVWLMPWQRDLLGLLNIPVVSKPFSPVAFRKGMLALASPLAGAAPTR